MSDTSLIQHDIERYLEHLELEKGRSLNTVRNYRHYLTHLVEVTGVTDVDQLDDDVIRSFRLHLNRQPGASIKGQEQGTMKKRTQNYYLTSIRSFLKFLQKKGRQVYSPENIELAKTSEREVDPVDRRDIDRMLEVATKHPRNHAIIELFFSTGLRLSELCSLNRDLDLTKDEFTIRGKGEKLRIVFLSPDAKVSLRNYLATRVDMDEALFVQEGPGVVKRLEEQKSIRLSPRSVQRVVKRIAIEAGVSDRVTPHMIRHSFATDLLRNGADMRSVQVMLGHQNIATTQVYTHVTDRHLREIHKKFHRGKEQ